MQLAEGKFKRVVAVRIPPGRDVMEALDEACEKANLNNGIIVNGIGSLKGAKFLNPIEIPEKKAGYGYGEPIVLTGPIELVNINGMICQGEDGERLFHIHCTFSDTNGDAYGGHFIESNEVLMTVDLILAELDEIYMGRRFDEDLDVFIFNPTQK